MPQAARARVESAYPGIKFRPKSVGWWARFAGSPAECVHLEDDHSWMALYIPDRVYLQGKSEERHGQRRPPRPEVSLCRACLLNVLEPELRAYAGRVVAFEPPAGGFAQYFFMAAPDFEAAGLRPAVSQAIEQRLEGLAEVHCAEWSRPATWLWLSCKEVSDLDSVERVSSAMGRALCAIHGPEALARSFERIPEANVLYLNLPYGNGGAYVWI